MPTVISLVTLKFVGARGEIFSLSPLQSKLCPDWVLKDKNFITAREKELLKVSGDTKEASALDNGLIKEAIALEIVFGADIKESKLEELVANAKEHKEHLIASLGELDVKVTDKMKISTLEKKLETATKE